MGESIIRGQIKSVSGEQVKVGYGDGETGLLDVAQFAYCFVALEVGMPVVLLMPEGNIDQAIALSGGFNDAFAPPSTSPKTLHYKRDGQEVIIDQTGVTVKSSTQVIIEAPLIKIGGAAASKPVNGNPAILTT